MNLRVEQDGRLCRITLAAPDKRNVLDRAAGTALLEEFRAAASDPQTGAILIEADGPVFCGGMDAADPPPDDLFRIGAHCAKPIVAAVKGAALSAGLALIANAHVAMAAQGSNFGLTDIREKRWHAAVFHAVAAAIGRRRGLELALTGRIFSTQEALAWGLIHSVAPAFEFDDRVTDIATALAGLPAQVADELIKATVCSRALR